MKQDRLSKNNLILYACGLIPVIWFALLTAPYMGEGLVGIIENLSVAFTNSINEKIKKLWQLFTKRYKMLKVKLKKGEKCGKQSR